MTTQPNTALQRVGAFVLIAIGALFLITNVFNIEFDFFGTAWPFFVILPGLAMLALAVAGDKGMTGFVFPGAIVTGTGLILLAQNITNYWESWAYVWALYPVFIGLAMVFQGNRLGNEQEAQNGRQLLRSGFIGFLVFGAFFELLIFRGNDALSNILIPLGLILVGAYLLFARRGGSPTAPSFGSEKSKNGAEINPALKRKIEEALAEDTADVKQP